MDERFEREIEHLTGRLDAIIREGVEPGVFEHLRELRDLSAAARDAADRASAGTRRELVERFDVPEAYRIAHALSLFFQLVNLCEERERLRRLAANPAPPMSLRRLFRELAEGGVEPELLQRRLDDLEIQLVLTAHPTEARRRAVLNGLNRVAGDFERPDEALEALWQTEEVRERRVGPLQEVESAVDYFDRSIFSSVAGFYEAFDRELEARFPTVRRRSEFLTFASWVGGDRDGNPSVTPEVSRTTAQWHACVAMDFYERECGKLVEEITHAEGGPGGEPPGVPGPDPSPYQPYETFRARLAALRRMLRSGKGDLAEIAGTLEAVRDGLLRQKATRAAGGRLRRLLTQVRAFGLHLTELDFRDHAGKLDSAGDELAEELRALGDIQAAHGPRAARRFILSMTRSAGDLLRLFRLAAAAGLREVDLVPLFETIRDLEGAPAVLSGIWADPDYRAHLRARGDVQEVMVGYSDSNKDGGYLAANWFLHRAQKEISRLADDSGVKIRFFHGKGGTIDRGGGTTYRSLRAQPHAAHGGRIRITEQGEVISLKYSNPAIALRNFEQLASAVIAGQCLPEPEAAGVGEWERRMAVLAEKALAFYQDLVYGTPEFTEYFRQATPIDLLEHLRLGSRPSRRQPTDDIRQLRAIPWVFAWTQSRHLLSAWYGVGHALEAYARDEPDGLEGLREMARGWPFFRTLLDNAEVSLAKTDLAIARQYAALVESPAVREKVFGLIEAEHARSVRMVLAVTGRSRLLEEQSTLAGSLRLRNPYVDPLNFLQIRFLAIWRRSPEEGRTEMLRRLLALTVNGIASGMKSTG